VDWDLTFVARDLGTIPGEALTSDKKSTHAKGPTIFWEEGTGHSHQHALHRTPRGPSPCQRIAFHKRTTQNGNMEGHNQLAPFSSFRHAAGPLVEIPTDE
jgi:hypothetical protein